jgi:hypothetical protein
VPVSSQDLDFQHPVYVSKSWYQYELISTAPNVDKYAFVDRPKDEEVSNGLLYNGLI